MYIYKITNSINGKVYIGQTVRPFRHRLNEYRKKGGNTHLTNAFTKYGFEKFLFEIVCEADSIEELNNLEIAYIQEYESCNRGKGYNLELGGRNAVPSEETKEKMRLAHLGIKHTEDWLEKRIHKAGSDEAKKYGRAKSEEERKIISEKAKIAKASYVGIARTDDVKRKISEKKKGVPMNPEAKKKLLEVWAKKVEMVNLNGEIIIFDSSSDAARFITVSSNTIAGYCKGKFKNKQGYKFKYLE